MTSDPAIRFVSLAGASVRVSITGSGPPLLLMAGIGGNMETWEPLMRLLHGRRVIAFDAPGAGATAPLPGRPRMRDVANLVAELLDELGCASTDVLGYSWGGALAQQFAYDHPKRVHRLILAGTLPGLGGVQHPARAVQLLRLAKVRDDGDRRVKMARLVAGRSGRDPALLADYERTRAAQPATLEGYRSQMRTITGWSSLRWLSRVRAPTLALAGEEDPIAPAVNTRIFCRLLPDCQRYVFARAGHLFLLDQPEDVAPVINGFLGDADHGRGRPSHQ